MSTPAPEPREVPAGPERLFEAGGSAPDWPWRALVEHNPDFVMLMTQDSTIRYINRVQPPLRPADVLGKRGVDFILPTYRQRIVDHLARAWETGATIEFEVPARSPSRTLWYYARITPLRTQGRTEVLMAVARDVTERRRGEQECLALQERLLEARRLESLGVLAGGVAHDFNNLLTGILGHASLARQDLAENSPAQTHLHEVEQLCLRAAGLCRQMLTYAGKTALALAPLDLNRLLGDSQALLSLSVPRHVTFELELAPALPEIRADAVAICQALLSLVVNAAEAIADTPGVVTLASGVVTLDDAFLRTHAAGRNLTATDYVFVEVRDTGCGMSEAVRRRIFEPFFSTKFTGRGLGLPAVQGCMQSHDGVVTVQSTPGQGTSVRLHFPRYQATG
jgi:PAS domain S-box-containing protein